TCPDARRPPRRCCTACCSCRRRSAAPERWCDEGGALMAESLQDLGEHIAKANAPVVMAASVRLGELTLDARPEGLVSLFAFLRDDPRCLFNQLADICGVDWPEREKRFDVIYNLLSLKLNQRLRVKVATDETTPVPSVTTIYSSA